MRKRRKRVEIYFTEDEFNQLTDKVSRAGMTREAFCRQALLGAQLRQAPPADYYKLIVEVRRVGSHLNQLLKKANTMDMLDAPMLRQALERIRTTEDMLWDAFSSNGKEKGSST